MNRTKFEFSLGDYHASLSIEHGIPFYEFREYARISKLPLEFTELSIFNKGEDLKILSIKTDGLNVLHLDEWHPYDRELRNHINDESYFHPDHAIVSIDVDGIDWKGYETSHLDSPASRANLIKSLLRSHEGLRRDIAGYLFSFQWPIRLDKFELVEKLKFCSIDTYSSMNYGGTRPPENDGYVYNGDSVADSSFWREKENINCRAYYRISGSYDIVLRVCPKMMRYPLAIDDSMEITVVQCPIGIRETEYDFITEFFRPYIIYSQINCRLNPELDWSEFPAITASSNVDGKGPFSKREKFSKKLNRLLMPYLNLREELTNLHLTSRQTTTDVAEELKMMERSHTVWWLINACQLSCASLEMLYENYFEIDVERLDIVSFPKFNDENYNDKEKVKLIYADLTSPFSSGNDTHAEYEIIFVFKYREVDKYKIISCCASTKETLQYLGPSWEIHSQVANLAEFRSNNISEELLERMQYHLISED